MPAEQENLDGLVRTAKAFGDEWLAGEIEKLSDRALTAESRVQELEGERDAGFDEAERYSQDVQYWQSVHRAMESHLARLEEALKMIAEHGWLELADAREIARSALTRSSTPPSTGGA